jgi:hypothetical protein
MKMRLHVRATAITCLPRPLSVSRYMKGPNLAVLRTFNDSWEIENLLVECMDRGEYLYLSASILQHPGHSREGRNLDVSEAREGKHIHSRQPRYGFR